MPIRLVIADDHPIVLRGLQNLFSQYPDVDVLACCSTGSEAITEVIRQRPDVLLVDLKMDGVGGLDVVRQLREEMPACKTVLLTAAIRDEEAAEALSLGVSGLILKDSPQDAVIDCIRNVAQGRSWIDRDTLGRAMAASKQEQAATPDSTLTPRELELVRLVAQGLRNKEIAQHLSITEGTVKIHLHNIYDKLGVDGRVELVLAAQHKRLV